MVQRPQAILQALAGAGHPVYFVDTTIARRHDYGNVAIVPSLDAVPGRDVIVYLHFPRAAMYLDKFDHPTVVYDILDDLAIYDAGESGLGGDRSSAGYHRRLVTEADVVMVSSPVLAERHRAQRSNLVVVENGVDTKRFGTRHPRPDDLPRAELVVGYHGAIAAWFDFDLLATVAAAMPKAVFVLIGPVTSEVRGRLHEVSSLPNVAWLGERRSSDIAAYVQSFDVGAIWFVENDLTAAVSPLKLYEYLASGVPVVSSPLPAAVAHPLVATPATADEWVGALLDPRRGDLAGAAAAADWNRRIQPLLEALEAAGWTRA
jgi:glycosyltransferase involved in cell wall biosynthesis